MVHPIQRTHLSTVTNFALSEWWLLQTGFTVVQKAFEISNLWLNLQVSSIIVKRQTLAHIERDMERWLKQRNKLIKNLEKCQKKSEKAARENKTDSEQTMRDMDDQIESLKDNITYVQDNINDCQSSIMQMEESKVDLHTKPI